MAKGPRDEGFFRAPRSKGSRDFTHVSFAACCNRTMLRNVACCVYGRSYPGPKTPQWWSTLRVMDPVGVKGRRGSKIPYEIHGFHGSNKSKVSAISKVLERQGFPREVMASRV